LQRLVDQSTGLLLTVLTGSLTTGQFSAKRMRALRMIA
jgi:hypothetical protein